MLKKSCALSLILLVGLRAGASAELVLHWGLDESSGATAYDSVGGNHGTLIGNTAWAPAGGKYGGAALFDGTDDSVRLTAEAGPFPVSDYPFTLMGWCKTTKGSAKAVILAVVQAPFEYYWVGLQNGRACVTSRSSSGMYEQPGGSSIADDQWHHVCGVYLGPDNRRLYLDGVEVTTDSRRTDFLTGIRRVAAGALDRDPGGENIVDEMMGAVDDVAIFNEALDVAAINQYMTQGIPTRSGAASRPSPADGETDVPRDIALSWAAGESADTHDVYFGTVFADVDGAGRTAPLGVLVSQGQAVATYDPDGLLDYGQTYYWRIDEVNSTPDNTIFKGDLWSFTVEPFAYPIRNIAATASSAQAGMGPENTVNGSGLDDNDQHSTEVKETWLTVGVQPNWIQYEFDKDYKLHELWVWNSNQVIEPFVGFGARNVVIEYSRDGTTWTALEGMPEFAQATGEPTYTANTFVDLGGVTARYVKLTIESNWGVAPQTGLSEVRFFHVPVQARGPQPVDGATDVSVDTSLDWRPGREAASHEVYFGIDSNAVADGSVPPETVTAHSYTPAPLDFGTAYYWKVDEVGDTGTYPGDVWSFTTQEYLVIDDFEGYTDDQGSRIYEAWIDGFTNGANGSTVGYFEAPFAEQTIVHGGRQSMPFEYNNVSAPFYSEAEREFAVVQDWTTNGADTLSLYFRGHPVAFLQRADGTLVMGAGGADIWGTADQFRFAYKTLSGNGSIVARVDSMVAANAWTKVGVMIRETLEAGSRHVSVVVTPDNGVSFLNRPSTSAASVQVNQTGLQAPYWVKLTRTGDTFTAQRSADGVAWTDITADPAASTVTVAMPATVYIGLAVTSHNTSMQTSAEFSNVAATGAVTGSWQHLAIGVAQPGNDPAALYVVLEDKAGRKKRVVHPDPEAVTQMDWQQWQVPLSTFSAAGVNVAAVRKMYLGVGDPDQPVPGAAGLLFIDDIAFGHPAAGQ